MAVTARQYTPAPRHLMSDTSWLNDTIKAALVTSAYVPDQDAHEFYSSVTGSLATANGYTAGGATLTGKTLTTDAATNQTRLDAADVSWTAAAGTTIGPARYLVVYKDTGVAGTSPLLGLVDFGADVSATGAPFSVAWDPTGVIVFTVAA